MFFGAKSGKVKFFMFVMSPVRDLTQNDTCESLQFFYVVLVLIVSPTFVALKSNVSVIELTTVD